MLSEVVDSIAGETGFAGVVAVHRGGEIEFARAYGLAHRAHKVPNTVDTRFAIASGTKGLTALAIVSRATGHLVHLPAIRFRRWRVR
jgi:CubicO group peptidase (beta-lactamase class C family)